MSRFCQWTFCFYTLNQPFFYIYIIFFHWTRKLWYQCCLDGVGIATSSDDMVISDVCTSLWGCMWTNAVTLSDYLFICNLVSARGLEVDQITERKISMFILLSCQVFVIFLKKKQKTFCPSCLFLTPFTFCTAICCIIMCSTQAPSGGNLRDWPAAHTGRGRYWTLKK